MERSGSYRYFLSQAGVKFCYHLFHEKFHPSAGPYELVQPPTGYIVNKDGNISTNGMSYVQSTPLSATVTPVPNPFSFGSHSSIESFFEPTMSIGVKRNIASMRLARELKFGSLATSRSSIATTESMRRPLHELNIDNEDVSPSKLTIDSMDAEPPRKIARRLQGDNPVPMSNSYQPQPVILEDETEGDTRDMDEELQRALHVSEEEFANGETSAIEEDDVELELALAISADESFLDAVDEQTGNALAEEEEISIAVAVSEAEDEERVQQQIEEMQVEVEVGANQMQAQTPMSCFHENTALINITAPADNVRTTVKSTPCVSPAKSADNNAEIQALGYFSASVGTGFQQSAVSKRKSRMNGRAATPNYPIVVSPLQPLIVTEIEPNLVINLVNGAPALADSSPLSEVSLLHPSRPSDEVKFIEVSSTSLKKKRLQTPTPIQCSTVSSCATTQDCIDVQCDAPSTSSVPSQLRKVQLTVDSFERKNNSYYREFFEKIRKSVRAHVFSCDVQESSLRLGDFAWLVSKRGNEGDEDSNDFLSMSDYILERKCISDLVSRSAGRH